MDDPEEGARQPLLRRMSSRMNERAQFQEAQREAVVNVAQTAQGFLARLLVALFWLCVCALAALWAYLYIGSMYILIFHLDEPCDQPLGAWLLMWFILPTIHAILDPAPPREEGNEVRRHIHSFRQAVVHGVWFGFGLNWFYHAKTCQKTNPPLYLWVKFVVHIYVIGAFVFIVFPLMMAVLYLHVYRFYHALIDAGWISNPKAASADTIDSFEVVEFDSNLFAPEDDPTDKRPSGECCCCSELFGVDLQIVRTPCGHYYHKKCLGEWLKLAKSCPLCRAVLDDAARVPADEPLSAEEIAWATGVVGDQDRRPQEASPEIPMPAADPGVETDEAMAHRLQEEEIRAAGRMV